MKIRISIVAFLLIAVGLSAQVHITVDDPETWSGKALKPYVNQTVVFDVPMVVCANANGNYVVSPWRRYEPESHGIILSAEYNETVRVNSYCMFNLKGVSGYHRCGEKIYGLTATVDNIGSVNKLTMEGGTWHGNTRAELEAGLPDLGDYRLLVCGFNLENYYLTWGSMGADSYSEHQIQRAKISKALKKINADIFGLVELQQGDESVAEIVSDLNKNLPGRNYQYLPDAAKGTFQKVDFVYDANTVEPINKPVETNVEVQNRKKMLAFRELATGEKFIYSINHFKSMNTGDADRRANEAQAVVKLYNSYRQNRSIMENDVLIMGDLNCYAFTEPIMVFVEKNKMHDLHRTFHADSSYSYMYGDRASYIDHAISNETLLRQVTGMAAYHINSDEDDEYRYDGKLSDETMFRCSDHDPVLVGLKLDSTLSGIPYFNGNNFASDSLTFYYSYAPREEEIDPLAYFDIYTMNGFCICPPTRIQFKGLLSEQHKKYCTFSASNPDLPEELKQLLPLPSGIYIIRIYYNGEILNHKLIVR